MPLDAPVVRTVFSPLGTTAASYPSRPPRHSFVHEEAMRSSQPVETCRWRPRLREMLGGVQLEKAGLLTLLCFVGVVFAALFFGALRRRTAGGSVRPGAMRLAVGFVTDFF